MLTTPIVFERYKSMKCKSAQMHFVKKYTAFPRNSIKPDISKSCGQKFKAAWDSCLACSTDMSATFFKPIASVQRGIDATDR